MATVSAGDVKALREKTGAPMMECKNALDECGGDFDKAEKLLKEKGLAAVEKRTGRATNEGKITIKTEEGGMKAALVELVSETDFVARNPEFIALGVSLAERVLEKNYTEANDELNAMVTELASKIRENMVLKRVKVVTANPGEYISSYIHGDGAIGVVILLRSDKADAFENEELRAFAFSLALHVAAFNPLSLDSSKVDPAWLKEQEGIFAAQMEQDPEMQSKPEKVRENILKGKVSKFLKDICFMDQPYVKDEKMTVAQALSGASKTFGSTLSIADYVYLRVGE
ncbi:MAG: translation elongation factor Ts [Treponema sp.]|nr:translation elongation factor Ts [Treponema sp.]